MLNYIAKKLNEETSFVFEVTSQLNSVDDHSWSIGNTKQKQVQNDGLVDESAVLAQTFELKAPIVAMESDKQLSSEIRIDTPKDLSQFLMQDYRRPGLS